MSQPNDVLVILYFPGFHHQDSFGALFIILYYLSSYSINSDGIIALVKADYKKTSARDWCREPQILINPMQVLL